MKWTILIILMLTITACNSNNIAEDSVNLDTKAEVENTKVQEVDAKKDENITIYLNETPEGNKLPCDDAPCQDSNNEKSRYNQCSDTDEFPCLADRGVEDEYNYCEYGDTCILAPIASCECSFPNFPGKSVNSDQYQKYKQDKEDYCSTVDMNCPQLSPPGPGFTYFNYEAQCVENVCRTVKTGILEVVR